MAKDANAQRPETPITVSCGQKRGTRTVVFKRDISEVITRALKNERSRSRVVATTGTRR